MSRAQQLLPIDRSQPEDVYPGMELTQRHREALEIGERLVPGPPGEADVRVVIYRPRAAEGPLPLLLHLHGGAFCLLSPDTFAGMEANWSIDHHCVVVSVDYRLAPEHPFPAAPEDCYAALLWAAAHADELGADLDRLVVTGGSAGGALTAALCLMARDRNGPTIAYQALMIPVIDDRLKTPSHHAAEGAPGFNKAGNEGMWLHYLGEDYDRANTSPYASPGRAQSLKGLPPAFVQTGGLDPLRDEGLEFAMRLMAEGVEVEIYNAPGSYHGADPLDPRCALQAARVYNEALHAALHPEESATG